MLILTRCLGQSIAIGTDTTVTLVKNSSKWVFSLLIHQRGSDPYQVDLRLNQSTTIGQCTITLTDYNSGKQVKFGMDAPRSIQLDRVECFRQRGMGELHPWVLQAAEVGRLSALGLGGVR